MNWPYFVGGFVWGMYSAAEAHRSKWSFRKFLLIWATGIVTLTVFLQYFLGV